MHHCVFLLIINGFRKLNQQFRNILCFMMVTAQSHQTFKKIHVSLLYLLCLSSSTEMKSLHVRWHYLFFLPNIYLYSILFWSVLCLKQLLRPCLKLKHKRANNFQYINCINVHFNLTVSSVLSPVESILLVAHLATSFFLQKSDGEYLISIQWNNTSCHNLVLKYHENTQFKVSIFIDLLPNR